VILDDAWGSIAVLGAVGYYIIAIVIFVVTCFVLTWCRFSRPLIRGPCRLFRNWRLYGNYTTTVVTCIVLQRAGTLSPIISTTSTALEARAAIRSTTITFDNVAVIFVVISLVS
jgi:hypothetical protein